MAGFDTSGGVTLSGADDLPPSLGTVLWSDLNPFTQGYVEAAAISSRHQDAEMFAFRQLSPEALARIMEDCERYPLLFKGYTPSAYLGGCLWADRQAGKAPDGFPPLAPYLGDDGKVYLRDAPSPSSDRGGS